MRRHPVDDEAVTRALDAVRDGLDREIRLAENGGPLGIEFISDLLLDYAAARSVTDPEIHSRDTWTALRTAAETAAQLIAAYATPPGETVRVWIEHGGRPGPGPRWADPHRDPWPGVPGA